MYEQEEPVFEEKIVFSLTFEKDIRTWTSLEKLIKVLACKKCTFVDLYCQKLGMIHIDDFKNLKLLFKILINVVAHRLRNIADY